MILMVYSINWRNFIFGLRLLFEIFGNMCIVIIFIPVCGVIYFEINLSFLIKRLSFMIEKVSTKILISWERKELFRWNKNHFSSSRAFSCQKLSQTWECVFNGHLTMCNVWDPFFMKYIFFFVCLKRKTEAHAQPFNQEQLVILLDLRYFFQPGKVEIRCIILAFNYHKTFN